MGRLRGRGRVSHPDVLVVQTPHLRLPRVCEDPRASHCLTLTPSGAGPPPRHLHSQFTEKEQEAQSGVGTGWPEAPEGPLRKELEVPPRPAEPGHGHPHPWAPEHSQDGCGRGWDQSAQRQPEGRLPHTARRGREGDRTGLGKFRALCLLRPGLHPWGAPQVLHDCLSLRAPPGLQSAPGPPLATPPHLAFRAPPTLDEGGVGGGSILLCVSV